MLREHRVDGGFAMNLSGVQQYNAVVTFAAEDKRKLGAGEKHAFDACRAVAPSRTIAR